MIPGMMLILASTMWFFAFNTPDGTLARVLSLFPFTAPLLMFMRISVQPPPAWEIALSIGILLAVDLGRRLVRGAGLPGRDPDVRQEADAPRDHPLGAGRRLSRLGAGPGIPGPARPGRYRRACCRGLLADGRGPVVQTPPSRGETPPIGTGTAHSSRGPGRRPLTAVTRVQIPYALPTLIRDSSRF